MTVYFYHTQDTERIVREWRQGTFPSHFLYGALQLADSGIDVVWHHQKHTYRRLRDMLRATWKILTCRKRYDVLYATHTYGIEPIILLRAMKLYRHPSSYGTTSPSSAPAILCARHWHAASTGAWTT